MPLTQKTRPNSVKTEKPKRPKQHRMPAILQRMKKGKCVILKCKREGEVAGCVCEKHAIHVSLKTLQRLRKKYRPGAKKQLRSYRDSVHSTAVHIGLALGNDDVRKWLGATLFGNPDFLVDADKPVLKRRD